MIKIDKLNILKQDYVNCHKCKLCESRTQVVFGNGNINCDLMIIGQSPGRTEDLEGIPFVGDAGQILDSILKEAKIYRKQCYITNSLLCFVKPGIAPETGWVASCNSRLHAEIDIIKPKIIVTLGKNALQALTHTADPIWRHRKPTKIFNGVWHIGTYHPSAAIYTGNTGILDSIAEDFKKAKKLLSNLQFIKQELI